MRHYKSPGFCLQNAKIASYGAQSPRRLRKHLQPKPGFCCAKHRGFFFAMKVPNFFSRRRAKINSFSSSSQSARRRRGLVTTAVWRCEPRSHGRNKAATPLPGRTPSVSVPHRSASPALCFVPVWARSIFSYFTVVRRRSLAGPCASPPLSGGHGRRPCARPREVATGRSRAVQGEHRCGAGYGPVRAVY